MAPGDKSRLQNATSLIRINSLPALAGYETKNAGD
jgi:hypothetical protein